MIPHIHTFTGNLLWEKTFSFASWQAGRTQRAQAESFQAGGKGVVVAKMLTRLGAPTTALFFPGGRTGTECEEWVRAQGITSRTFTVPAPTRAGLVVRVPNRPETTFLGPDVPLAPEAARACAAYLDTCPAGGVLAICGSIPGWNSGAGEPLQAAIGRWLARGPVVADTYGPPLMWLAECSLAWVKINRTEFDTLFGEKEREQPMAEKLGSALERWPAKAWVVTDGPQPVWVAER
ncbi:MAG: PfkB family carbohydrate kinase, partial [Opitutaceae bacterium]